MKKFWLYSFLISIWICIYNVPNSYAATLEILSNTATEISYSKAIQDNGTLSLSLDYSNDNDIEVIQDIIVSTDEEFNSPLPLISSRRKSNTSSYLFESLDTIDKIYVKAPVLYSLVDITPTKISLYQNQTEKSNNSDWITIGSISISPYDSGIYSVNILFTVNNNTIPRLPRLNLGQENIGGISAVTFTENGDFKSGNLIYKCPADTEESLYELLEHASLTVEKALTKVECSTLYSIPSISVEQR